MKKKKCSDEAKNNKNEAILEEKKVFTIVQQLLFTKTKQNNLAAVAAVDAVWSRCEDEDEKDAL